MSRADSAEFIVAIGADAVDLDAVHAFLSRAYWSEGIPRETVARAIAGSIPFSVLHDGKQVGFARVITDRATFGYLADVYILEEYRGRGLSLKLMDTIMAHPDLQGLRRFLLVTRDAHGVYRRYGFNDLPDPSLLLCRANPDPYGAVARTSSTSQSA